MKQLQNNFTTPEQSKRLLELGVSADSADCYIDPLIKDKNPWIYIRHDESFWMEGEAIPCWSVGRLMEIFEICTPYKIEQFVFTGTYIEQICKAFLFAKEMKSLDFSKLEE